MIPNDNTCDSNNMFKHFDLRLLNQDKLKFWNNIYREYFHIKCDYCDQLITKLSDLTTYNCQCQSFFHHQCSSFKLNCTQCHNPLLQTPNNIIDHLFDQTSYSNLYHHITYLTIKYFQLYVNVNDLLTFDHILQQYLDTINVLFDHQHYIIWTQYQKKYDCFNRVLSLKKRVKYMFQGIKSARITLRDDSAAAIDSSIKDDLIITDIDKQYKHLITQNSFFHNRNHYVIRYEGLDIMHLAVQHTTYHDLEQFKQIFYEYTYCLINSDFPWNDNVLVFGQSIWDCIDQSYQDDKPHHVDILIHNFHQTLFDSVVEYFKQFDQIFWINRTNHYRLLIPGFKIEIDIHTFDGSLDQFVKQMDYTHQQMFYNGQKIEMTIDAQNSLRSLTSLTKLNFPKVTGINIFIDRHTIIKEPPLPRIFLDYHHDLEYLQSMLEKEKITMNGPLSLSQ